MKKSLKLLLLSISITLVIALGVFFFGNYTTHNISNYLNGKYYSDVYAEEFLPKIYEIKNSESIDFTYHRDNHISKTDLFLTSNSYILNVKYSKENYNTAVDKIKNKYEFYSEHVTVNNIEIYRCHSDNIDYPRIFGMIGIDKEENRILFMFFVDEGNMQNDEIVLINKYFKKFINA